MGHPSSTYKPVIDWIVQNEGRTFNSSEVPRPPGVSEELLRHQLARMVKDMPARSVYDPLREGKFERTRKDTFLWQRNGAPVAPAPVTTPPPGQEPSAGDLFEIEKVMRSGDFLVSSDSGETFIVRVISRVA